MKTNASLEVVGKVIETTKKKFNTLKAKILMDKGDYRNVALEVEAGKKGSKLASEGSEKLTKNVCDHVMIEFIKQITKEKYWVQMHDGKTFGISSKGDAAKNDPLVVFNNTKLCYCEGGKPEVKKEEVKKEVKKDPGKKGNGKAKTLDGVLKQENKAENKKLKKELSMKEREDIHREREIAKGEAILEEAEEVKLEEEVI